MLSALCHNDTNKASGLLTMIVSDNDATKEKVVGSNVDVNVNLTNSIESYDNLLTAEKGCTTNENHRKIKFLIEASLRQSNYTRNDIIQLFNLSKKSHNDYATGIERNAKTLVDWTKDIEK